MYIVYFAKYLVFQKKLSLECDVYLIKSYRFLFVYGFCLRTLSCVNALNALISFDGPDKIIQKQKLCN